MRLAAMTFFGDEVSDQGRCLGEGEGKGGGSGAAVGREIGDQEVVSGEVQGYEAVLAVGGEGAVEEDYGGGAGGIEGLEVQDGLRSRFSSSLWGHSFLHQFFVC